MSHKQFLSALSQMIPPERLLFDEPDKKPYTSDWTNRPGNALAVVFPKSAEEVSRIIKLCQSSQISVVPSGGRTGLAAGAVATPGSLVISLIRMNKIKEVDEVGRTVRAEAGVVTHNLHQYTKAKGLRWPIDLASEGSCTIGGNLSTNAGGIRVIRYGMARKWVTGLQVVTAQGEILELNGELQKNNTGYDLVQLIIGTEGTLAVITEATLKLTPIPKNICTVILSAQSISLISKVATEALRLPYQLEAFEFFCRQCLKAVCEKLNRKSPLGFDAPYYVIIDLACENEHTMKTAIEEWASDLLTRSVVSNVVIANSSEEKRKIWGLREGITESISLIGPVRKYDLSIPVAKTNLFIDEVNSILNKETLSFDLYLFGHIADGSPHLNLVKHKDTSMAQFECELIEFEKSLYKLLKYYGGSISSEHGVGLLKKDWLTFSRSNEELRLFRAIKRAFDPNTILNPGKIIDP